jgi:RNA polymerase sigma factor (sigma-70 family)
MGLFQRKYSDAKLVALMLSGGRAANRALDHVYVAMGKPIKVQLIKDGATSDEVADAFQNAVVDLLVAVRKPGFEIKKSLADWLFVATKHHFLNDRKQQQRLDKHAESVGFAYHDCHDVEEARRIREILEDILARLDTSCRLLLEWTFLEGLDREWIAKAMQFSNLNSVSNKRSACLETALGIGRERGYFKH